MPLKRKDLEVHISRDKYGRYFSKYNGMTLQSVFQPIFKDNEEIVGYEALLRITDSNGEFLRTDMFFKSADYNDDCKVFVERLSRVIHLRNFAQSTSRNMMLFLNIVPSSSAHILNSTENTQLLMDRLNELKLSPNQIVIEIIELDAYNNQHLKKAVDHLKSLGFSIAIDDYGVDSSNLDRVGLVRPDIIKLDKSLLDNFIEGKQKPMFEALELSNNVNADIVIEGIENEEQFKQVSELNVPMYQGFHLALPLPLDVEPRKNPTHDNDINYNS